MLIFYTVMIVTIVVVGTFRNSTNLSNAYGLVIVAPLFRRIADVPQILRGNCVHLHYDFGRCSDEIRQTHARDLRIVVLRRLRVPRWSAYFTSTLACANT